MADRENNAQLAHLEYVIIELIDALADPEPNYSKMRLNQMFNRSQELIRRVMFDDVRFDEKEAESWRRLSRSTIDKWDFL